MASSGGPPPTCPPAHLPGLLGKACLFMLRLLLPLERPKTSVYPILSQRTEYDGKYKIFMYYAKRIASRRSTNNGNLLSGKSNFRHFHTEATWPITQRRSRSTWLFNLPVLQPQQNNGQVCRDGHQVRSGPGNSTPR